MKSVPVAEGFKPIASGEPNILILGSMPSAASIQKQQYYGHARNAFWPIMIRLLGSDDALDYDRRKQMLIDHGVALWDVLRSCRRQGSLDADIAPESIRLNDFVDFFDRFSRISQVFFNGGTATSIYQKQVLPSLPLRFASLAYTKLPSTSPANASVNFAGKLEAWRAILPHVVK